jgi:hypothetical protein
MSLVDLLGRVTEAPVLAVRADARTLAIAAEKWQGAGLTVFVLRGWKMRTVDALFDEFAAAMQFPYYFGENWAAFDECLAQSIRVPSWTGLVVAVLGAADVLVEEPLDLPAFRRCVDGAHREYSAAIELGELWDRPAVPFHLVLGAREELHETLRERFEGAVEADLGGDGDPPAGPYDPVFRTHDGRMP